MYTLHYYFIWPGKKFFLRAQAHNHLVPPNLYNQWLRDPSSIAFNSVTCLIGGYTIIIVKFPLKLPQSFLSLIMTI